jgi:Tfp pilus assembly protein PilV
MKKHNSSNKSGFTLLETVVGSAVFMIGTLGSFSLMSWTMQANDASGQLIAAAAAAQAKLEELVETGYDDVSGGSVADGRFDLSWTVTPGNGVKLVGVQVAWASQNGKTRTYTASTSVCNLAKTAALPWFAEPERGGSGGVVFSP